jgi:uncharacterized protein GlcG (DUF336 family)
MMTMDKAQLIIAAAIAKAKEIGQPMNIAVVDAGTNLKAFMRMDGAWLGSIDIAICRRTGRPAGCCGPAPASRYRRPSP